MRGSVVLTGAGIRYLRKTPYGRAGAPAEANRLSEFGAGMRDPVSDPITGGSLLIDGDIELPLQETHRLEKPAYGRNLE